MDCWHENVFACWWKDKNEELHLVSLGRAFQNLEEATEKNASLASI